MDQRPETQTLVERARAGDRVAFDRLVRRFRARTESLIRLKLGRRLRQRVEVEDVLQESFLRAFRSLKTLEWEGDASFARWLGTVVENVIRDLARHHLRSRKAALGREVRLARRASSESGSHDLCELLAADGTSPSQALRRDERFERLERALDELSPDHREVIVLACVQGVPVKEVAARLGRSPNAVSKLLFRALRELRQVFGNTDSLRLPPRRLGKDDPSHGEG